MSGNNEELQVEEFLKSEQILHNLQLRVEALTKALRQACLELGHVKPEWQDALNKENYE